MRGLLQGVTPRVYSEGLLQGSTSKRKYRVGGGATTTEQLSCALREDKNLFCVVEDIWWLCARCTTLECNNLGSISEIKLKKVRVEVKKIKTDTI